MAGYYPLPKDTVAVLRRGTVSNLGLLLERFVEVDSNGKVTEEAKKYSGVPLDYFAKGEGAGLLQAIYQRQLVMLKAAGAEAHTAGPQVRCIVGLGVKGAREVGIRLHHLYGCPIIPGSALKGLARARALTAIFDTAARDQIRPRKEGQGKLARLAEEIEEYAYKADQPHYLDRQRAEVEPFRHLFGTQGNAGQAIFYDALPISLSLELDIMNPHYPDYYNNKGQGNHPPADYDSPTPVNFLTVGKASRFLFGVAARNGDAAVAKQAWDFLQRGLEQMGIGAKTTSGYGVFTNFQQVQP